MAVSVVTAEPPMRVTALSLFCNVLTTVFGSMFDVGDSAFWIASVTSA